MSVLVTGAGGFIGSHLVEALLRRGDPLRALVRYNGRASWGHLEALRPHPPAGLDVHLGDVTDASDYLRAHLDQYPAGGDTL